MKRGMKMYKNNYFAESANAVLKLDKNPKRGL